MINRRGQSGLLLEVFLLILILVLFTMFWGFYARSTFIAGLLDIDDRSYHHTCSNMVQVIIGTDYIIDVQGEGEPFKVLVDYLDFDVVQTQVPDANYFYAKIAERFPDLTGANQQTGRVGVTVIPSFSQGPGFVDHAGISCPSSIVALLGIDLRCSRCEFPLYSTNEDLTARVVLEVLV